MIDPSMDERQDLTDTEVQLGDQAARDALARRVVPEIDDDGDGSMAQETETVVRQALAVVDSSLDLKRSQRELLNVEIKTLVDEQTVLRRAVHVFDRWNASPDENGPDDD